MSGPWTEAHRREALRRTYEIAAQTATALPTMAVEACSALTWCAWANTVTELAWRMQLDRAGLAAARIDREVRRVRGLAEGRLVREVFYGIRLTGTATVYRRPDRDAARASRRGAGGADACRVARVTRIRRAP